MKCVSDADRIALMFGGPGARTFAAFANAVTPIDEDDGDGPAIAAEIYGYVSTANGVLGYTRHASSASGHAPRQTALT